MRILAIGNIHGCASALDTLLESIDLQPDDTLVTLGDYVDRGPDSRQVIDRLIDLTATRRVISLRGNHDQMMLAAREGGDALRDWRAVGGAATIQSYKSLAQVPESHWRFLETTCIDYWECETHFFVHGGVYPDLPLADQPGHQLYWGASNKLSRTSLGRSWSAATRAKRTDTRAISATPSVSTPGRTPASGLRASTSPAA